MWPTDHRLPLRGASAALVLAAALCGCASTSGTEHNPDPLEPLNRITYRFNDTVDKAVMMPLARGYKSATPAPVRKGVGNFFGNLESPVTIVNDFLQAKFRQGGSDTARLAVNTTVGLLGFFDPASGMGLPPHDEDFGQTLGTWGIGPGPYLVLPFLGPSDVRDTVGKVGDYEVDPLWQWQQQPEKYELRGVQIVDIRARLLSATNLLQQSIDPYLFMRNAYLQRRRNQVYDGNPPPGGSYGAPPPPPPGQRGGRAGGQSAGPPPPPPSQRGGPRS
ncbi:MAG TPA: VacJ family lipoprotein [Gammaproteobacteria bacterium]|nr:VacJ family lipoprotein [Gammaproteobacteria bacterium]